MLFIIHLLYSELLWTVVIRELYAVVNTHETQKKILGLIFDADMLLTRYLYVCSLRPRWSIGETIFAVTQ